MRQLCLTSTVVSLAYLGALALPAINAGALLGFLVCALGLFPSLLILSLR